MSYETGLGDVGDILPTSGEQLLTAIYHEDALWESLSSAYDARRVDITRELYKTFLDEYGAWKVFVAANKVSMPWWSYEMKEQIDGWDARRLVQARALEQATPNDPLPGTIKSGRVDKPKEEDNSALWWLAGGAIAVAGVVAVGYTVRSFTAPMRIFRKQPA